MAAPAPSSAGQPGARVDASADAHAVPKPTTPLAETTAAGAPTLKNRIVEHYDETSSYYADLWSREGHIHHGLWDSDHDTRTKEEAVAALVLHMAQRAHIHVPPRGAEAGGAFGPPMRILDAGCGIGGTALMLARRLPHVSVLGVSLSGRQVTMARHAEASVTGTEGEAIRGRVGFVRGDMEKLLDIPEVAGAGAHGGAGEERAASIAIGAGVGAWDVVWACESVSHLGDKDAFFRAAATLLKPGGKLVLADWHRAPGELSDDDDELLATVEDGMLVPRLETQERYAERIAAAGLHLELQEDLSERTARTWDITLGLIAEPSLWRLAFSMGSRFVAFLKSFAAIRDGYRRGAFRYGVTVASKPAHAPVASHGSSASGGGGGGASGGDGGAVPSGR